MMIKVWGRTTSVNVQAVMWALGELDLPVERVDAGGAFGGLDTPEFRAMNPNRLVPVLRDGNTFLWESAAIVRYLGARYGSDGFWPADPLARAQVDMWAEWMKTSFAPLMLGGIFWPLIRTRPENLDLGAVGEAAAKLRPLAEMLDERLASVDHLGGARPCFADIIVGAQLYRYFTLDFERAATPHLEAYYERLAARPAYATHVMVSYDSLRAK